MADAKPKVHTVVDGRLKYNGKLYRQFEQIELDPETADKLVKKGVVAVGEVKAPAPAKPTTQTKEAK